MPKIGYKKNIGQMKVGREFGKNEKAEKMGKVVQETGTNVCP